MRSYTKVPLTQIKQAVRELTREELESYAILNGLLMSVIGSMLVPGSQELHFGSMLTELGYPMEEASVAADISKRVQDRVAELTTEAN